jgi:membrane associated rhomboid family serine protease
VTPWVLRLLIANVIVYFLQQTTSVVTGLGILLPEAVLVRPWTLVTYMFLHDTRSLWHIIGNMLGLYFFGPRLEARLGSNTFIALYMVAGLGGALLSFATPSSYILGASGGVLGITLAYAMFWPRDQIMIWGIIPVEVRWLVVGYTLYSIFGIRSGGGNVAHYAHLGGMVAAFLFMRLKSHNAAGQQFKRKVAAGPPPAAVADYGKVDRTRVHAVNRDEVDRILDKISASGITSLTAQERIFLSNFVPMDDRKPH